MRAPMNVFEQDGGVDGERCDEKKQKTTHAVTVGLKNTDQRGGETGGGQTKTRHK